MAPLDGQELEFEPICDSYRDRETGSAFDITGRATDGPLAAARLARRSRPVPDVQRGLPRPDRSALSEELAASGVRVNSLHPGQIDTDMHARQRERTPELIDKLVAGIPVRRIGAPREVADAALFLASDESRYVTASELVIDGGVSA